MRIQRKVVQQLLLTPAEVEQFMDMLADAQNGKTVHYSERRQADGSYFGISVDAANEAMPPKVRRPHEPEPLPRPYA